MRSISILFVLFAKISFAQETGTDSLYQIIHTSKNDTIKITAYLELSRHHRSEALDSSIWYAEKALTLSRKATYLQGEGMSLHFIGGAYFFQGDYAKSMEYEKKAIDVAKKNKLTVVLGQAYNTVALINHYKANYPEAIHYYLESLKLEEQNGNNKRIASVRINLTNVYRTFGDFNSAQECALQARKLLESMPQETILLASITTAQGMISLDKKDYAEAMNHFTYADSLFTLVGDRYDLIVSATNVGFCNLRLNRIKEATPYIEKAYDLAKDFQSIQVIVMTMSNLSELRVSQNRVEEGIKLSLSALELSKANKIGQHYVELYGNLQKAFALKGDYKKSNEYWQLAYSFNDSIKSSEISNAIRNSTESYEVWKKQEELNLLTNERNLKNAELTRERNFRIFLIVIISLLILTIIIVWYAYRANKRLNRKLKNQNQQINNQNKIIEAVNEELQEKALRSQTNPHFIFNCLNSIQYLIVSGDIKKAVEYHTKFSILLRRMLEYSDREKISVNEEAALLQIYLELESLRLGHAFSFTIQVEYPDSESTVIPPLLIQPIVENALVHGLAPKEGDKKISIVFRQEKTNMICEITDNGVGRETSARKKTKTKSEQRSRGLGLSKHRLILNNKKVEEDALKIVDHYDENGKPSGTTVILSFVVSS